MLKTLQQNWPLICQDENVQFFCFPGLDPVGCLAGTHFFKEAKYKKKKKKKESEIQARSQHLTDSSMSHQLGIQGAGLILKRAVLGWLPGHEVF